MTNKTPKKETERANQRTTSRRRKTKKEKTTTTTKETEQSIIKLKTKTINRSCLCSSTNKVSFSCRRSFSTGEPLKTDKPLKIKVKSIKELATIIKEGKF